MWHHIGQQQQDASVDASTPSAATAMPAPQVDALQEIMQRLNFMEQAADALEDAYTPLLKIFNKMWTILKKK
jgi:hypothetical protein